MAGAIRNGGSGGLKAEINVTPLVDVVLVLLIIFMVVTPMLTRGRNVQLPVAAAAEPERAEARDALVLTISADQKLWLDNRLITADELSQALKLRQSRGSQRPVLIKADASVSVRTLRPVLQTLKAARISEIAFAVLEQRAAPP